MKTPKISKCLSKWVNISNANEDILSNSTKATD